MFKNVRTYSNERKKQKEFNKMMKSIRNTIDEFDKKKRKNEKNAH